MDSSSLYDERALFIRISEGDEAAFAICYSEYGRGLLPFLTRLTGSGDDGEEVMQEVFLKIWLYRDKLAEVENPRSWLFRVAANTARNWLKKKMRAGRLMPGHQGQWEVPDSSPSEQVDMKSIAGVVHRTIRSFPPQRRRIYQLSREEGLKPAEIAARLGVSVSTVKNTLLSALKTIRENIEGSGFWGTVLFFLLKK
jgi:RNA polymerase sigma-70 factor (ECF subfamily)